MRIIIKAVIVKGISDGQGNGIVKMDGFEGF